ncbi:YkuJ family protein [Bacillus xiapuensis]|uniref:YkuJ family protein n=1 Tax=Bacillus xiapuensis TaxID=2014075 RepID=UPI000C233A26|nr:YkuJ family protein [Bacillus xiapuensis]
MSQLIGIVQRLKSLQEGSEAGEVQQRLFEVNGRTLCQVKYLPGKDTFELEVYDQDGKGNKYPFDDIDMTAIEIFDLLQEAKQQ